MPDFSTIVKFRSVIRFFTSSGLKYFRIILIPYKFTLDSLIAFIIGNSINMFYQVGERLGMVVSIHVCGSEVRCLNPALILLTSQM